MKKILSVIAVIFILAGSLSCKDSITDPGDTEMKTEAHTEASQAEFSPYKYGIIAGDYMYTENNAGVIVKYNVHNGDASYLCPDPFCSHRKADCQFYGVNSFKFGAVGDTVYYVKQDDTTGKAALYSYDVKSGDRKTLLTRDGYFTSVYAYEKKLLILWIEKTGLEGERFYFWYDTETGDTEDYNTDLDGGDFKEHDFGYRFGNYYKTVIEPADDGREAFSLYVTFAGDTEPKRILRGAGPILFYENKIVYFGSVPEEEQKVVHKYKDGTVEKDEFGGNVYVMNPDGSDAHLLFHTDAFLYGMTDDTRHPLASGDYIGILTAKFKNDETVSDDLIIANINTGEFVITNYK